MPRGWRTVRRRILYALVGLAVLALPARAAQDNFALAAFQKLQSLEGDWRGKDQYGQAVKSYFSPLAANTAVMETLTMDGEQMVSLYSIEANSILLVHYCPSNNQPRLRAQPSSEAAEELVFSFVGAANLPSLAVGHERKLVIEFEDSDHITERWTWSQNGKDTDRVFRLERIHLSRN